MTNLDEIKARRARLEWDSNKSMHDANWDKHHFGKHAPTDIDWLIAEVERLREERKKLQENPMTRLTDERIAEIEAKLSSYDFKDSLGHPLTNCKDFQYLLAEMKVLKAEKAQAEAERDVLADACARIIGSPDGQEFPPLVHKGNITKWLNYAQQQAEKQGEQE